MPLGPRLMFLDLQFLKHNSMQYLYETQTHYVSIRITYDVQLTTRSMTTKVSSRENYTHSQSILKNSRGILSTFITFYGLIYLIYYPSGMCLSCEGCHTHANETPTNKIPNYCFDLAKDFSLSILIQGSIYLLTTIVF